MSRKIIYYIYNFLIILTLVAVLPSTTFAIGNPDSDYRMGSAYLFKDVLVAGDALYVATFDLKYTVTPDAPATDTWQVILFDDTPTTDVIFKTAPLYADQNPWNGYNEGVFGVYETIQTVTTGDLKFCLNPVDSTGLRLCTSSITTYTDEPSTVLNGILVGIFENLEKEWRVENQNIDLIETLTDITQVLTLEGEDYALHMIANLRTILPEIFSTSIVSPNIVEESYDTSSTDTMQDFFDGTELDSGDPNSSLSAISTYTKIPVSIIGVVIVFSVAAAIAGAVISSTGRSEVGMLAGIMCITAGTYVGLIDFALAAVFAMLGALALGYIFFYKSSTS